jgi:hypothetical protein
MVSYVLNVDKAGDLKFGRKKCRLHKKDEVVKVARDYGIPTPSKKTVKELCGSLKKKIQRAERVSREEVANMNNVPLAKLYPEAAKRRAAAKKRAEKKALDKKIAANFMRNMTTRIMTPARATVMVVPRPQKKAMPLTKKEAIKRIRAMKGLNKEAKYKLVIRVEEGVMSPRRVVKVARELSRLNAAGYRVFA